MKMKIMIVKNFMIRRYVQNKCYEDIIEYSLYNTLLKPNDSYKLKTVKDMLMKKLYGCTVESYETSGNSNMSLTPDFIISSKDFNKVFPEYIISNDNHVILLPCENTEFYPEDKLTGLMYYKYAFENGTKIKNIFLINSKLEPTYCKKFDTTNNYKTLKSAINYIKRIHTINLDDAKPNMRDKLSVYYDVMKSHALKFGNTSLLYRTNIISDIHWKNINIEEDLDLNKRSVEYKVIKNVINFNKQTVYDINIHECHDAVEIQSIEKKFVIVSMTTFEDMPYNIQVKYEDEEMTFNAMSKSEMKDNFMAFHKYVCDLDVKIYVWFRDKSNLIRVCGIYGVKNIFHAATSIKQTLINSNFLVRDVFDFDVYDYCEYFHKNKMINEYVPRSEFLQLYRKIYCDGIFDSNDNVNVHMNAVVDFNSKFVRMLHDFVNVIIDLRDEKMQVEYHYVVNGMLSVHYSQELNYNLHELFDTYRLIELEKVKYGKVCYGCIMGFENQLGHSCI